MSPSANAAGPKGAERKSATVGRVLPQLTNIKLQLTAGAFLILNKFQIMSSRTRSEMSAPKAKRRQDVAVSECNRPGRSRQEVCERRASPAPAKADTLLVMLAGFLVSRQTPVGKKQDSKRSLCRPGGSQQIFKKKFG